MITTAPNSTSISDEMLADHPSDSATPAQPAATTDGLPEDVRQMIATSAYYIAQGRGFEPGHEVDDWLAAEAQVLDSLAEREV
jgi:hypothetical protein